MLLKRRDIKSSQAKSSQVARLDDGRCEQRQHVQPQNVTRAERGSGPRFMPMVAGGVVDGIDDADPEALDRGMGMVGPPQRLATATPQPLDLGQILRAPARELVLRRCRQRHGYALRGEECDGRSAAAAAAATIGLAIAGGAPTG